MLKVKLLNRDKEISPKVIDFGTKKLVSPVYSQIIESGMDLEIAKKVKRKYNLQNSSLHVAGLLNINKIMTQKSETLHRFLGSTNDIKLDSHNGLIVDPSFEYIYHKVKSERKELSHFDKAPKVFQDLFKGDYSSNVSALMNSSEKIKLVEWAMTLPMEEFDALFPLPPSFPIKNMKTLEHSLEINRIGITTAKDNGWHESFFFNLDSQRCFSEEILTLIYNFIKANENDVNTIVLKLRNGIRPSTPLGIASFRNFLERLRLLREDKAVMLLNTDSFGLLGIGLGAVDIFAEPLDGQLNKDIRFKKSKEGKAIDYEYDPYRIFGMWLNPKDWMWWKFQDINAFIGNNHGKLPCNCPECSNISMTRIRNNSYEYNQFRRRHAIVVRDEQMEQLRQNMIKNNLRGAIFDKLNSTDMSYSPLVQFKGWFA